MEIKPVITDEQKKEFNNPFPTPKGQLVEAHYSFFIPTENNAVVEKLVDALTEADMNLKLFDDRDGIYVKAQFRKHTRYDQAESILLPILQRLDIPQFTSVDGDITLIDNQGELMGWITSDYLEMCEADNAADDSE